MFSLRIRPLLFSHSFPRFFKKQKDKRKKVMPAKIRMTRRDRDYNRGLRAEDSRISKIAESDVTNFTVNELIRSKITIFAQEAKTGLSRLNRFLWYPNDSILYSIAIPRSTERQANFCSSTMDSSVLLSTTSEKSCFRGGETSERKQKTTRKNWRNVPTPVSAEFYLILLGNNVQN